MEISLSRLVGSFNVVLNLNIIVFFVNLPYFLNEARVNFRKLTVNFHYSNKNKKSSALPVYKRNLFELDIEVLSIYDKNT